jgi:hypothetical protein
MMGYSESLLVYEDEPAPGYLLTLIFLLLPAMLLAAVIYLWSSGESTGGPVLVAEALFIGLIFWIIFPRSYRVYDDHIRIVLGGPFSIKVGFDRIRKVEVTSKTSLTVNFVTALARTHVKINKKTGLAIAITPRNQDMFTDHANRALDQWARSKRMPEARISVR